MENSFADESKHGAVAQVQEDGNTYRDDNRDMFRLGRVQELRRRFRFLSIFGYIAVAGGTWEFALATTIFGLSNGGTAGAIWLSLVVCFGMMANTLSFAEAASMAPTAGGQYHFVSEFSPPRYQKLLSYMIGWLCTLGWQTSLPACSYVAAQQVIALITIVKDDYVYHSYHAALLTIAFALSAITFNTIFISKLPALESVALTAHIGGFIAIIVVLWVLGPRDDPEVVFTQFTDNNGWGSVGLATLLGMIGPVSTFIGVDSAVHLAEELENASYVLPRAIVASSIVNYIIGFVTIVSFMSNLGNVDELLASSTGQPWVALILKITNSVAGTAILIVLLIVLFFFCAVNVVTTTSRQIWSFARDKGLPFHRFLSKVHPKSALPLNAVSVSLILTCLFSFVIIGSTLAFNIILSIMSVALLSSYAVVISCILLKKLRGEKLPASKFNLGRFGIAINIVAIAFSTVAGFFLFWPAAPNPDPASMNWICLIYGVVVIFSLVWYWFRGRFEYDGPVEYVRKDVE